MKRAVLTPPQRPRRAPRRPLWRRIETWVCFHRAQAFGGPFDGEYLRIDALRRVGCSWLVVDLPDRFEIRSDVGLQDAVAGEYGLEAATGRFTYRHLGWRALR